MSDKAETSVAPVRARPSAHSEAVSSDAAAKMRPVMRSAVRTPRMDGSSVSDSASAIGRLMEEKHGRMLNTGGSRGYEGGQTTDHIRHQFLIVIQKHYIENISRTEIAVIGRN
jgi:hypothetical protein